MATTINAYSVSLGLDSSNYINSAKLTRSETRELSKSIDAARTPAENYANQLEKLRKALNSGAIDSGTHSRLLDNLKTKYGMADQSALSLASSLTGPVAAAFTVVAGAATAAIAAGTAFVMHMKETQNEIDAVADSAGKLGVSYNELIALRFAAQEAGGVEASVVDESLKKMQIAISKGSTAFAEMGLNAAKLKDAGAVEAFNMISDRMATISDNGDKLRLSAEIFGKSGTELVSTLASGRDSIQESVDFMQKWSGLTDAQVLAVQNSNDAWDRIGIIIDGISTKLAGETAAVFLMIAEHTLGAAKNVEDLDRWMSSAVENAVAYAGIMKDLAELNPMGLMDGSALDFTSAETMLAELIKTRSELESQALRERFAEEETIQLEVDKTAINAKHDAWLKMVDDVLAKEEAAQNKLAQDALKNAEKYFADERNRQLKLREEVSKGPASMEAGSAEAARFMADQVNQAIGEKAVPLQGMPTEQELLMEAMRQTELMQAGDEKQAQQVELLRKLLENKPEPIAKFR